MRSVSKAGSPYPMEYKVNYEGGANGSFGKKSPGDIEAIYQTGGETGIEPLLYKRRFLNTIFIPDAAIPANFTFWNVWNRSCPSSPI